MNIIKSCGSLFRLTEDFILEIEKEYIVIQFIIKRAEDEKLTLDFLD